MVFFLDYASFLLKAVTIVAAIIAVLLFIVTMRSGRFKELQKGQLNVQKLNEHFDKLHDQLEETILDKAEYKKLQKEKTKAAKANKNKPKEQKPRAYILDFIGDIKASAVESLRQEITAILTIATPQDEVIVRLESAGGMVHSYGLAASQLSRIREANIPLTICVDKVAASGGYMMACLANKILSAPFAIIGSIGVVAQIPNAHRLLKKHNIDYEVLTAGEYKRTMTIFGENTAKGREKFQEDLETTHNLFKQFISNNRPQVVVEEVATGEIWLGQDAYTKQLVDGLTSSDQYLLEKSKKTDLYLVHYSIKKPLQERIGLGASTATNHFIDTWLDKLNQLRFWR